MFTEVTWQDVEAAEDKAALIIHAVERCMLSPGFRAQLTASAYFRGENSEVARKTILRARKLEGTDAAGRRRVRAACEDVVGNRIASGFLFRFVTQQNQFLLGSGCLLPGDVRQKLGADFDHQLAHLGELALLHGTAWGYWNADHLEVIEEARNPRSGFFPLLDEMTSRVRAGVQFWQLREGKPRYIRFFEEDGVSVFRVEEETLITVQPKRPYRIMVRRDALGEAVVSHGNYGFLPLIPLHANRDHLSEFKPSIKSKIDAYDRILSDFADNLDRANDVYWVLNNFGGTTDEVAELLEEINRIKAVANISDGSGSATAEPRTIEVPYAARRTALELLERALYQDYMALDMDSLTSSSLTNVAIRVAAADLNIKADLYEREVQRFMLALLHLVGCPDAHPHFRRQTIANESETVADIAVMRDDIDRRTALMLNPYIDPETIDTLLTRQE